MARSFNGSSDYYSRTSAVINAVPMTFSCWFNSTAFPGGANVLGMVSIWTGLATNHRWNMGINSSGQSTAGTRSSISGSAISINSTTTGTWNHAVARYVANNDRNAVLNGDIVNMGTDSTVVNVNTGVNRTGIAITHDQGGTPTALFNGQIAEVAIWNVALSDDNVVALSRRKSPLLVRRGALRFYAPLIRLADERILGETLTAGGSPTIQPHIGIEYPRHKMILPRGTPVAAPSVTLLQMQRHGRRGGRLARTGGRQ
jgi:hypothetical protein